MGTVRSAVTVRGIRVFTSTFTALAAFAMLAAYAPFAQARNAADCDYLLGQGRGSVHATRFGSGINSGDPQKELRSQLHALTMRNHHPLTKASYREVLYENLVPHPQHPSQITDVYCNETYTVPERYSQMYDIINVEHTWPQSRFSRQYPKGTQKMDLHHLFIANSKVNNSRANYEFGEVERERQALECDDSKLGYDYAGHLVFEPPDTHKGAVARAIFYFAVRYDMAISPAQRQVLQQWNHEFPVTQEEHWRNDRIEALQGNRNPFVDDASLADKLWGLH